MTGSNPDRFSLGITETCRNTQVHFSVRFLPLSLAVSLEVSDQIGLVLAVSQAMVNGRKQIENRSWKIPKGWSRG